MKEQLTTLKEKEKEREKEMALLVMN